MTHITQRSTATLCRRRIGVAAMSIWIYEDTFPAPTENDVTRETCLFCETEMKLITIASDRILVGAIRLCNSCGWWSRNERHRTPDFEGFEKSLTPRHLYSMDGACAQLRNLDIADISIPLDVLRAYLLAKYSDRFNIAPRKLEELVGNVFGDHGYSSYVTAYQNDGGIDVMLCKGHESVGVQVKRYKNRIEAEQIRAFAGALMLGDHPSGIFVTTSEFRSGAITAAEGFTARGIPIQLMDAQRLYDALRLKQNTDLSEDNLEEFVYGLQAIGESKTIYEDEGPH
jgi:restriction system protein